MRKLHKHWASSSTESMAARPQQQGSGELCSFALRNQKHSISQQSSLRKGGNTFVVLLLQGLLVAVPHKESSETRLSVQGEIPAWRSTAQRFVCWPSSWHCISCMRVGRHSSVPDRCRASSAGNPCELSCWEVQQMAVLASWSSALLWSPCGTAVPAPAWRQESSPQLAGPPSRACRAWREEVQSKKVVPLSN